MASRHPDLVQAIALSGAGRDAEAMAILERVAATRDPEAMFMLADQYWRGKTVERDFRRGRALFAEAAEAGNPMAVRAITNLMASGTGGARDWPAAIARLREEARTDPLREHMLWMIDSMAIDEAGDPVSLPQGEVLSEAPQVTRFRGAFTPAECDYLIIAAEPSFQPSLVIDSQGKDIRDPVRTSDGATFHCLIEDPAVHALNRRIAALSGTRWDQGEPLQILRYRPGQQYRRHSDWLGATANPRILTAIVYLNERYEGGETEFHRVGLKVKGQTGDVLVFRNGGAEGMDRLADHAGLPIVSGTKYLASRWIREGTHTP